VDVTQALSADALMGRLDAVIRRARPALPADLTAHFDAIRGSIGEVLPKLTADIEATDDLYLVREMCFGTCQRHSRIIWRCRRCSGRHTLFAGARPRASCSPNRSLMPMSPLK